MVEVDNCKCWEFGDAGWPAVLLALWHACSGEETN